MQSSERLGQIEGKVAIITGAAKGIGKTYALTLAREGSKVVIADVDQGGMADTKSVLEKEGLEALVVRTDVTSEEETTNLAWSTSERFGRIDILVNNAALARADVIGGRKKFHEITLEDWNRVMLVNMTGVWLCCKAVAPYMMKQKKGKIINISSDVILGGPDPTPGFANYVASKGAVDAFSKYIARELGEFGVNVNTILPGIVNAEGMSKTVPKERFESALRERALHRHVYPEDLAKVLVFLASENSDLMTGQRFIVDGGRLML